MSYSNSFVLYIHTGAIFGALVLAKYTLGAVVLAANLQRNHNNNNNNNGNKN